MKAKQHKRMDLYRSLYDEVSLTAYFILRRFICKFLYELVSLDVDVLATS